MCRRNKPDQSKAIIRDRPERGLGDESETTSKDFLATEEDRNVFRLSLTNEESLTVDPGAHPEKCETVFGKRCAETQRYRAFPMAQLKLEML